ncbi:hypothetical protein BDZ90DRAFT_259703 [Jaminaea rosea]|uniref:Uncharacterized protein n=1 Tax=Jaminaea rosea TaxID=1569628 RepID=A0A316UZS2_9BASI|nr:hypothetical protein BDZ90DRAFT_259703 [Jaminaea rosea]PWN28675.1 hypothetical protein BDZ90DRAFT_259703 [Jaminaea rosea]
MDSNTPPPLSFDLSELNQYMVPVSAPPTMAPIRSRRDAISLGCLTSPLPPESQSTSFPGLSPQSFPWDQPVAQSLPTTPAYGLTLSHSMPLLSPDAFALPTDTQAFPWNWQGDGQARSQARAQLAELIATTSSMPATSVAAPAPAPAPTAAPVMVDHSQPSSLLLPAWSQMSAAPGPSSAPLNANAGTMTSEPHIAPQSGFFASYDPMPPTPSTSGASRAPASKAIRSPPKVIAYQGRVREQRIAVSSVVEALRTAFHETRHPHALGRRVRGILAGENDLRGNNGSVDESSSGESPGDGSGSASSPSHAGSPPFPRTPQSQSSSSAHTSPSLRAKGHMRQHSAPSHSQPNALAPPQQQQQRHQPFQLQLGADLGEYRAAIRRLQQNAHKHRLRNRDVQEMAILCDVVALVMQQCQRQPEFNPSGNAGAGAGAGTNAWPVGGSAAIQMWDAFADVFLRHRDLWPLLVAAERRLAQAVKLERQKVTVGWKRRRAITSDDLREAWQTVEGGGVGMGAGINGGGAVEYGRVLATAVAIFNGVRH